MRSRIVRHYYSMMAAVAVVALILPIQACVSSDDSTQPPKGTKQIYVPADAGVVLAISEDGRTRAFAFDKDGKQLPGMQCQMCTPELEKDYGKDCEKIQTLTLLSNMPKDLTDISSQRKKLKEMTGGVTPVCAGLVRKVLIDHRSSTLLRTHGSHQCWYYLEQDGRVVYEIPWGCSRWGH